MTTPSLFSPLNPRLQLIWDATSIKLLMTCPEKYRLTMLEGWRGSGVHVEFGSLFAHAQEHGWKARAQGATWEETQFLSVKWALLNSGERGTDGWRPWGGAYLDVWHCTGLDAAGTKVKFKNARGNAAKCPYSHKGKWWPDDRPETCSCGAMTQAERLWVPNWPDKNRNTLVRTVAWYWEEMRERAESGSAFEVITLANGLPAVELQFILPTGYKSRAGEDFMLAGRLDKIARYGDEHFICDNKTTKKTLDDSYFSGYSPDVQVDTYDLAGSIMLPELAIKGVMIEGTQVLVTNSRFANREIYRTESLRAEYLRELGHWFAQAEQFAETGEWPKNRSACWSCQFNGVCSKAPEYREQLLAAKFEKRHWNPLSGLEFRETDNT